MRAAKQKVAVEGYTFPCDPAGHVDLDAMSERERNSYLYARAVIGRELSMPAVQLSGCEQRRLAAGSQNLLVPSVHERAGLAGLSWAAESGSELSVGYELNPRTTLAGTGHQPDQQGAAADVRLAAALLMRSTR